MEKMKTLGSNDAWGTGLVAEMFPEKVLVLEEINDLVEDGILIPTIKSKNLQVAPHFWIENDMVMVQIFVYLRKSGLHDNIIYEIMENAEWHEVTEEKPFLYADVAISDDSHDPLYIEVHNGSFSYRNHDTGYGGPPEEAVAIRIIISMYSFLEFAKRKVAEAINQETK